MKASFSHKKSSKRNGGIFQGLLKKIALLILICFAIRFLSSLGAGDALDSLLRGVGENSNLIKDILLFELGGKSDSREQVTETEKTQQEDSFDYPSESIIFPPINSPPASPANTESPAVTTIIAEETVTSTPDSADKQNPETPPGEIEILNRTSFDIDVAAMLQETPAIKLSENSPQILIIHTHTSEAFCETETSRTLDKNLNVTKVGEVFAEELQRLGFNVLHDTGIYDYPSYSGSYSRSLEAIESYLKEYPSIQVVFDIHRDSITLDDGTKYRTEYKLGEHKTAQIMLLIATGEAGLDHPNWRENLKFGLRLQNSMDEIYPGLARPICISRDRYNQHAVPGSILVEIGTDGNSIQEAVTAAKLFAESAAAVIEELII